MKNVKRLAALLFTTAAAVLLAAGPVQAATYKVKEEKSYYASGKKWISDGTVTYKYDAKGRQTSRTYTNGDATNESRDYYDAKGNYIKSLILEDGKEKSRTEYTYAKTSLTVKAWNNKKYAGKSVYKLNKDGTWNSCKTYDDKNKLSGTTTLTRNKHGDITKVVYKDAKGKVISTSATSYTYKNNRMVKSVDKDEGGTATTTYYTNGNKKSWKYVSADKAYSSEELYDSKGRLTRTVYKNISADATETVTYKKGWPVKSVSAGYTTEDGRKVKYKDVYTYKYKYTSGRVTQQILYNSENTATYKTTYKYVKI